VDSVSYISEFFSNDLMFFPDMEAACFSEMSVFIYGSNWCHVQERNNLCSCCRKNLKSQTQVACSIGSMTDLHTPSLCSFCSCFSLEGRFEDEELRQILDDIQTKRSLQYWHSDTSVNVCVVRTVSVPSLVNWLSYWDRLQSVIWYVQGLQMNIKVNKISDSDVWMM